MSEKLKPCDPSDHDGGLRNAGVPYDKCCHCGDDDLCIINTWFDDNKDWLPPMKKVACLGCFATGPDAEDIPSAIAAWNTRQPTDGSFAWAVEQDTDTHIERVTPAGTKRRLSHDGRGCVTIEFLRLDGRGVLLSCPPDPGDIRATDWRIADGGEEAE